MANPLRPCTFVLLLNQQKTKFRQLFLFLDWPNSPGYFSQTGRIVKCDNDCDYIFRYYEFNDYMYCIFVVEFIMKVL